MEADKTWAELLLVALAILLYGCFEGIEVALLSAQKERLRDWQNAGRPGAALAFQIRDAPEQFLATVRIAMTFLGVFAAVLSGAVAVQKVGPWLAAEKRLVAAPWAQVVALGSAIAVLTYVMLIWGQLVPKALALQYPEQILCWTARLLVGLRRLCSIAHAVLTASLTLILWLLGQRRPPESASITAITEEAVTTMVREGAERGIFEEVEHELIEGVFEFADTAAREIMVPRVRIQALEVSTPPEEVLRKMSEIGHSRVPVYRGDLDHIVGVLYFKDVLRVVGEGKAWEIPSLLHPPLFVPEMVQISRLLRMLQQRRLNMAIVIDEHGGVSGLVTIEDILEQLVGEIGDEGESPEEALVTQLPDGAMVIQGNAPLRELRERFHLPLEESSDYHTLAGFLLARLGQIPQGGETVVTQGYRFTVVDVDGPRIARVKVEQQPDNTGEKPLAEQRFQRESAENPHGKAR